MAESSADTAARPLRFGIMCRGHEFAAWEALCITNLLAVEGVEPALLIVDDRPVQPPSRGERLRALFDPRTLVWRLYQRLVLNRQSRSTQPVDLSVELAGVPVLRCRPNQFGKFVQRFRPEEVDAIRAHDLDFVMRFAFNILRGDVLESARHGVWSFHHDDPELYRGQPPGFWEICQRDPVIGTVLQRLTERLDAGVMLHRGWFKADPTSYPRSRDGVFFGAADWPARLCREIQAGTASTLTAPPLSSGAPIYRAPNSWHMLRFLWITLRAIAALHFNSLFRVQQWSVGVIDAPVEQVTDPELAPALVRSARWLPEPPGRFLADPFAVATGDGLTLLVEDYDWRTEKGHIAALSSNAEGAFTPPRPVIVEAAHLSYPYLIQLEDGLYCIPEMNEANEAALYRASPDLRTWTRVSTLMTGVPLVDPTLFRHEGRWWLLATRADHGANLKLFGWHAAELAGPWIPHTANPLKTDIRASRPAGPPFMRDGRLHRPAQDCSTGYGAALVVHRILALTPERFEEEPVARLVPDRAGRYPSGLHTLCGAGRYTIIDGSRSAFIPAAAAMSLRRKTGRLLPGRRA